MRFIEKATHTFTFLFLLVVHCNLAAASDVLRSSVSPEFLDGLDAKVLVHISKQMEMELEIVPMPFARRVLALRQGDIDIMVGLREGVETRGDFVYLQPSHESLRTGYFLLKDNYNTINSEDDLKGLLMGASIVRSAAISEAFLLEHGVKLAPVTSLQQKIDMLLAGRTDLFSHFIQSTFLFLEQRGLEEQIVLAKVQRPQKARYHVALSTKSALIDKRIEFEEMLKEQVISGAFIEICRRHYNVEKRKKEFQKLFCYDNRYEINKH